MLILHFLLPTDGEFFNQKNPSSPSLSSSSGGSPRIHSLQSPFPSPPVIAGAHQQAPNEEEIFHSDLQPGADSGRVPMEDSYNSLNSMDLPPAFPTNHHLELNNQGMTSASPFNNRSTAGVHGGPPPLPENFTKNLPMRNPQRQQEIAVEMSHRGATPEHLPTSQRPQGARPKTTGRSQDERQTNSRKDPRNMKRTSSWENSFSSSSSSDMSFSSGESYNSSTWPKTDNPIKHNGNPTCSKRYEDSAGNKNGWRLPVPI